MSDVVEVLYKDTVVVESGDNKVIVIEPKVIINQSTSGGGTWGTITGDIGNQSDLSSMFNTKENKNRTILDSDNFDEVTANGKYSASYGSIMLDVANAYGQVFQRAIYQSTNEEKFRWQIGGEWNDWVKLADTDDLAKKMDIAPTVLPIDTSYDTLITNGVYQRDYAIITVKVAEESDAGRVVNQVLTLDDGTMQYRQYQNGAWNDWKEVAWWNYTLEELAKKMNVEPTVLPVGTDMDTVVDTGVYVDNDNGYMIRVSIINSNIIQTITYDDGTTGYRYKTGAIWGDWLQFANIAELSDKVDKVTGKGLSTNDYTNEDKQQINTNTTAINNIFQEELPPLYSGKVDKVEGKGLSTNDYTNADKTIVDKVSVIPTNPERMYLNGNKEYTEIIIGHSQLMDKNQEDAYQHITADEKDLFLLSDRFRINATDFIGGTASPYQSIVIGGVPVIVKKFLNQNSYYYTTVRLPSDSIYLDNIRFILTESVMPTAGQYIDFTINGTLLRHAFNGKEVQNQMITTNVTIGYDDVGNQVNTLTISGTYLQKIGIVSMDFFYSRGI